MRTEEKRVILVHNPTAGWGNLSQTQLLKALERGGCDVRAVNPEEGLGKGLRKQADVVIAAGGDGTVNAVARRLVQSGMPLIILPLGTANNLARTIGVESSIEQVLETLAAPRERALDVGVAVGSWGERYFTESAGVGWFCDALQDEVKKEDKAPPRALDVLTTFLEKYEPKHWRVVLDGVDVSGEYVMVDVMNAGMLGPNIELGRLANPFDGQFDVMFVSQRHKARVLTYLDALRHGQMVKPPRIPMRRARHVHITLEDERVRVDDQVRPKPGAGRSHFADLHVLKGALRLWLPKEKAESF